MIETERLILRNFREEDLEDYFDFVSQNDVLTRVGAEPYTDKEKAREKLLSESQKPLRFAIVLKENNKVIGNISLNDPKPGRYDGVNIDENTKELGYILSHDYWGRGIMPEAGKRILEYAFDELGVAKVVCGTKTLNKQSVRTQEKIGFKVHSIRENVDKWVNGEICGYIRTIITAEDWKNRESEK